MDPRERSTDVERAAERLRLPRARLGLGVKRLLDMLLAALMIVVLAPLMALVCVLLAGEGGGWLEDRVRLGRDGQPVRLFRFCALPGALGRGLEWLGLRDAPVLFAVLLGRLSFVG